MPDCEKFHKRFFENSQLICVSPKKSKLIWRVKIAFLRCLLAPAAALDWPHFLCLRRCRFAPALLPDYRAVPALAFSAHTDWDRACGGFAHSQVPPSA